MHTVRAGLGSEQQLPRSLTSVYISSLFQVSDQLPDARELYGKRPFPNLLYLNLSKQPHQI